MKASAIGCPLRLLVASFPMMNIIEIDGPEICRQPVSSSSTHVVVVKRQLTHGYSINLFFFHINCPLLHNLVDFKLTDLWSLFKLLFWAQRSGKIIWLIPRSEMHLMPKTRVHLPLAPFLTKGVVSSSARFSFPYISRSFLIFLHFILADLWERDRERLSLLTSSI